MEQKYCSLLSSDLFRTLSLEFDVNEEILIDTTLDTIRVQLENLVDNTQLLAIESTDEYDIWNYKRIVHIYSDFMEEYRNSSTI